MMDIGQEGRREDSNIITLICKILYFSNWYGSQRTDVNWDENNEPTAADHGDVLYNIGKSDTVGRYRISESINLIKLCFMTDYFCDM